MVAAGFILPNGTWLPGELKAILRDNPCQYAGFASLAMLAVLHVSLVLIFATTPVSFHLPPHHVDLLQQLRAGLSQGFGYLSAKGTMPGSFFIIVENQR